MKTYTRKQYVDLGFDKKCGGDYWNDFYVCRMAFKDERIQAVRWEYIGTGLWCAVEVLINGAWLQHRLY